LAAEVAFVTGARGQGAVRDPPRAGGRGHHRDRRLRHGLAELPLATGADLARTVKDVEALDRRIIAEKADIRDLAGVQDVLDEGVAALGGRLDIVAANAAVISWPQDLWAIDVTEFRELIDVTLTGTFITLKAAVPHMIAAGNGGSIVLTSSGAAITAGKGLGDYKAAKNGVLALKDTLAYELAEHFIRVNAICPTAVDTPMIHNDSLHRAFRPDLENPGRDDVRAGFAEMNLLPIPWVDPVDVSNAIVWLCSDAARYVTGITLPVDAGNHLKC
jgi:NAD(P)-dependent dehydrogenase (short-subunit alcohol dehydrogenase family)